MFLGGKGSINHLQRWDKTLPGERGIESFKYSIRSVVLTVATCSNYLGTQGKLSVWAYAVGGRLVAAQTFLVSSSKGDFWCRGQLEPRIRWWLWVNSPDDFFEPAFICLGSLTSAGSWPPFPPTRIKKKPQFFFPAPLFGVVWETKGTRQGYQLPWIWEKITDGFLGMR